jgi:uncharacterized protein YjbJ (UPF0337 family)
VIDVPPAPEGEIIQLHAVARPLLEVLFVARADPRNACRLIDYQHNESFLSARRSKDMVTQQQMAGRWHEIKGQVKKKWGALTDQDLTEAEGDAERLVGLVQRKTGESRQAIEQFLDEIVAGGASLAQQVTDTTRDYARAAGQFAEETYDRVADTVREGYERAEKYVERNPTQTVGMAFGAGLLLGVIVGLVLRR